MLFINHCNQSYYCLIILYRVVSIARKTKQYYFHRCSWYVFDVDHHHFSLGPGGQPIDHQPLLEHHPTLRGLSHFDTIIIVSVL